METILRSLGIDPATVKSAFIEDDKITITFNSGNVVVEDIYGF